MIRYKYGRFTREQIDEEKKSLRKKIFYLLLCVDPNTKQDVGEVDVDRMFNGILYRIEGLNIALFYPPEIVGVISLLLRAKEEYDTPGTEFAVYRKLILDAGAEILKIGEREV